MRWFQIFWSWNGFGCLFYMGCYSHRDDADRWGDIDCLATSAIGVTLMLTWYWLFAMTVVWVLLIYEKMVVFDMIIIDEGILEVFLLSFIGVISVVKWNRFYSNSTLCILNWSRPILFLTCIINFVLPAFLFFEKKMYLKWLPFISNHVIYSTQFLL